MSLRVLYITNEDRFVGGSSLSLETLLSCVGDAVEPVLLFRKAGPVRDRFAAQGYRCLVVPYYRASFQARGLARVLRWLPHALSRAFVQARCVRRVRRLAGDVDLVHTNSSTIDIGPRIARALGVPHVWHIREYPDIGLGLRMFPSMDAWRRKLLSSDAVVAITPSLLQHLGLAASSLRSEDVGSQYLQQAQAPASRSLQTAFLPTSSDTPASGSEYRHARPDRASASGSEPLSCCIPDAVLPASAVTLELPKEPFVLFLAGTLALHKHPDEAIVIFALASLPEPYKLVLVGELDEAYCRELLDLARTLQVENRIEFRPFTADVRPLLSRAAAVLVCTAFEGMGRVAVEALFYGCPVIARNSGGSRDVLAPSVISGEVEQSAYGTLYDSEEAAAEALASIVAAFPEAQVRAGAAYAARTFSTENYGARILALYRSLLP